MVYTPKILAFAGSARRGSYNKMLVNNAAAGAKADGAKVTLVDLRGFPMPLYDADLEAADGIPASALEFKKLMASNDGFLIASPEYNGFFPPLLKNVIDWASRRVDDEPAYNGFEGKVAAIMAASPGALGGLRALAHLRTLLANMRVMVLPDQKGVPNASNAFDDQGVLTDVRTREAVERMGARLAQTLMKLHG
ncbi:MAG: NAD(P)H-dependent oxidoreductase [Candidatus Latescibacterota bacterium]|nr:MAG: NAD(P)H-dependent oxidoreductase [Candidatus Latescibacterota bacterium]